MRSTILIWFRVSTGKSAPGMKMATPRTPFCSAKCLTIASTTGGRSAGTRAASWWDVSPARAAIRSAITSTGSGSPGPTGIKSVSRTYGTLGSSPSEAPKSTHTTPTRFRRRARRSSSSSLGSRPQRPRRGRSRLRGRTTTASVRRGREAPRGRRPRRGGVNRRRLLRRPADEQRAHVVVRGADLLDDAPHRGRAERKLGHYARA